MNDIEKGDRVKVTIEGVVVETYGEYGARVNNDDGQWLAEFYGDRDGTTIEKIEPPVEVFKPGDVVRSLATGAYWYLATNGYVRMTSADFPEPVEFYEYTDSTEFTSGQYEKVDL